MADADRIATLDPWEPDPKWHPARAEAFIAYRDMGAGRSYAKVAKGLGKSTTIVSRWGGQDNWPERASAWDAEQDRQLREEFSQATADVARAQAEDAAQFRDALLAPARALRAKIQRAVDEGKDPFEGMTVGELLRLSATAGRAFAQVATVERLAHGLSTENVAGHDGGPLVPPSVKDKSIEELEAYLTGVADASRERAESRS